VAKRSAKLERRLPEAARSSTLAWATVPMRLFLGVTFVYAGFQKVADPGFLAPGSPTYIGTQLQAFAGHSPIGFLINTFALPLPLLTGAAVIVGRLAPRVAQGKPSCPAGHQPTIPERVKLWDPLALREMTALVRDPVLRGRGVPHGDGRPVLLVPGFLSGDWSLMVLHNWLQRVGYRSFLSGIQLNVAHSEHLIAALRGRLKQVRQETGSRVSFVGHSRGGVLSKVISSRVPDSVEQVIGLGSPFADQFDIAALTNVAVGVVKTANQLRFGRRFHSEGRFAHDLRQPPAVPTISIYTRSDDVVNFRSCLRPDIPAMSVWGSHNGMIVNPEVYRLLGRLLARPRRSP